MDRSEKCNTELPVEACSCNNGGSPQVNEAGSAEEVTQDQASVLVPLNSMQNSLEHKRNLVSKNQKQDGRNKKPGFWITVFLLVCSVGGLGAYVISTYIPRSDSSIASNETSQPILSLEKQQSATIKQGQMLNLHGDHFGANDTITFLLDFNTPIKDENGNIISVRASSSGGFDVLIPIKGSDWSADSHFIQAVDNGPKQIAYLNIVVSPASSPEATSQNLELSMGANPLKKLIFKEVVGQGNLNQQRVTLTNTSGSPLHWTATANADHNLSWLVIDDNHLAGDLNISGTDSIGISVLMAGLKSNSPAHPYTGQIMFTINGQEQLALPVELQVVDPQSEMVLSPNPVVANLGAGNTCLLTTLTLTNLGNSFITWTLVPYNQSIKDRIQFMADGQAMMQGVLAASGDPRDTQALNLKCNGVSAGNTYKFTLYANSVSWLVTILIQ
jgi:hypothetical protein